MEQRRRGAATVKSPLEDAEGDSYKPGTAGDLPGAQPHSRHQRIRVKNERP